VQPLHKTEAANVAAKSKEANLPAFERVILSPSFRADIPAELFRSIRLFPFRLPSPFFFHSQFRR
jgi:hypothetical protein